MLVACPLGTLCIGLMCSQGSDKGLKSQWIGFDKDNCPHCRCVQADNPFSRNCTTTVTAADNLHGLGLMGKVNFNLLGAAFALEHGMGFQMSKHICPAHNLAQNCFYRPVSHCEQSLTRSVVNVDFYQAQNGTRYGALYKRHHVNDSMSHQEAIHVDRSRAAICSTFKNEARDCYEDATGLQMWRAIARAVLVEQPEMEEKIQNKYLSGLMNSTGLRLNNTFAAMHIRWGDRRYGRINEKNSMLPACAFAQALDKRLPGPSKGMYVFVASDEGRAISDLRECPEVLKHHWNIVSMMEQHGEVQQNPKHPMSPTYYESWDEDVALRLWTEIKLMVQAAFVVGQFRSNVDSVVQMLRTQPPDTYVSLDEWRKPIFAPW